jgi:hypothetical protein
VALATGELLLLHTAAREWEEAGALDCGVAAAAWSPDGDALAAVGAGGARLLLLSKVSSVREGVGRRPQGFLLQRGRRLLPEEEAGARP